MTQLEVNKILEILNSKDWSSYYVIQNNSLKKNIWFYINDIPEFSFVKTIVNDDLKNVDKTYKCSEWLTLLIYEKDDFFGLHKDDYLDTKDRTIFTGGYLLNDDFDGGEFNLYHQGKEIILEKKVGNTYIFDVAISHEVKPILKGIRYSLIWFIQNNHVKVKSNKFL